MKLRSILNTCFPYSGEVIISQLLVLMPSGDWQEVSCIYTPPHAWTF